MPTIDYILNENEKIIWRKKPHFWAFVLPGIIFSIIILSLAMGFILRLLPDFFLHIAAIQKVGITSLIGIINSIGLIFISLGLFVLLIAIITPALYFILLQRATEYAITDKRVIFKTGVIGIDFEAIDYDKVQSINVTVGIIGKIYKTGTIIVSSGGLTLLPKADNDIDPRPKFTSHGIFISAITEPYNVFKVLKKVALDVKTDIEFPTKFRPEIIKGYRTDY